MHIMRLIALFLSWNNIYDLHCGDFYVYPNDPLSSVLGYLCSVGRGSKLHSCPFQAYPNHWEVFNHQNTAKVVLPFLWTEPQEALWCSYFPCELPIVSMLSVIKADVFVQDRQGSVWEFHFELFSGKGKDQQVLVTLFSKPAEKWRLMLKFFQHPVMLQGGNYSEGSLWQFLIL